MGTRQTGPSPLYNLYRFSFVITAHCIQLPHVGWYMHKCFHIANSQNCHTKSDHSITVIACYLICLHCRGCVGPNVVPVTGDVAQCLQQCLSTPSCIVTIPEDHLKVLACMEERYITTFRLNVSLVHAMTCHCYNFVAAGTIKFCHHVYLSVPGRSSYTILQL